MDSLIFYREDALKPVGGPAGYLYNIKKIRDEQKDKNIHFLTGNCKESSLGYLIKYSVFMPRIILSRIIKENDAILNVRKAIYKSKISGRIELNKYSAIHFHSVLDLYSQKKNLENYKGKIIFTSHSPKTFYKELIEDYITEEEYKKNKDIIDKVEEMDRYAFERADYIIFPCPGAEEPYYHSWPLYEKLRDESKIKYLPTGIIPAVCKKSRKEVRTELNIPEDAIVLSFVGRHNKVKGYDNLIKIFSKLDNVYVVCCGNIGGITPPKSNRWIEVGWTTDPYSYVGASDIYMLPNRETYFDIAMLQTLSIGKCSVISNTGGNKEFVNTSGVKLYDSVNDAVRCINSFISLSRDERIELEQAQREEFREKYIAKVFYEKYKETLSEILKEENND